MTPEATSVANLIDLDQASTAAQVYEQFASDHHNIQALSTIPDGFMVIARDGQQRAFDASRIHKAIFKAFYAVYGAQVTSSQSQQALLRLVYSETVADVAAYAANHAHLRVEQIQDIVVKQLINHKEQKVIEAYNVYRHQRHEQRQDHGSHGLQIKCADGSHADLDAKLLSRNITKIFENQWAIERPNAPVDISACMQSAQALVVEAMKNLFDGADHQDVRDALILVARSKIEKDPSYTFIASGILNQQIRLEALSTLNLPAKDMLFDALDLHIDGRAYLKAYFEQGIAFGQLDVRLADFDHEQIIEAVDWQRESRLNYLGLQTLYDRYFCHHKEKRYELPTALFLRVAMGLALNEKPSERTSRALAYYDMLSNLDYMTATPTLFNSGTVTPQLSSCFLTSVADSIDGIFVGCIAGNASLSKVSGGIGNSWTKVRAMGSRIVGTNGKSLGVVPFMNIADATAVAVNQGGKRKGAVCAYLETWHLDYLDFLELRKNTGDDRRRTHDMNTASWVNDLLVQRVIENGQWTMFCPTDVPDLHDLYGQAFKEAYEAYEAKAAQGLIAHRQMPAKDLWRKMLSMLFETGHPWFVYKDPCNLRSPQQHDGVVHSSNLCTEITLNTSSHVNGSQDEGEIAVCNLGSINLAQHILDGELDIGKLRQTVFTAVRMLDNVVDLNFYALEQARRSNVKHRPVGLGCMGFQDALYKLGIAYASDRAVEFADYCQEYISYYAIEASVALAKERGRYPSYDGSLWSQGILPIDSIALLSKSRPQGHCLQDTSSRLDWDTLREQVLAHGVRNSNIMAIAPTATISNIVGVSASIEPYYQNLFVKSNLSGEFTVINPHLIQALKAHNLWDDAMISDLKYYNGSIQSIDRIPQTIKTIYQTAFEIDAQWLIKAASRRQKWIDQAQSLNLYVAKASGKKLHTIYTMAYYYGLKSTYYLRTLGATSVEKSTMHDGRLNAVSAAQVCSVQNPDDCQACQ